jgi:F420-dependent oxidoreductase-like protein
MKFGIHNPSWLFGPDPYELFEGLKSNAQRAESQGYAWFSVMDHLIQIQGVGEADEPFMESWTVLSALAAVTHSLRLATLVSSVSYRNPAHLAKMAATVDVISRGRLTFGIGGGWNEMEYRQYGWEFPARPAVRLGQMEEAIRIALAMWQEPRATFHGRYFHIEEAILEPKPVQKPHPPIMIGGSGEQLTLRAVARLGDACNLFGQPPVVAQKLGVLRRHCEAEGRNYDDIEKTNLTSLLLAHDEAELKSKRERLKLPDQFRGYALTTSQAVDVVGAFKEAGSQMLITSMVRNDPETQDLLASEVMPHFK